MSLSVQSLPPLPRREHDPGRERIGSATPAALPVPPAPAAHVLPTLELSTLEPLLARLAADLPTLRSALLCGSDGMARAAYGLSPEEAAHLSVLTSSLHSMSAATAQVHSRPDDRGPAPVDFVSLATGGTQTVVVVVPAPTAGSPLLAVTADDVSLGRMLLQTRATAERIAAEVGGG